MGHAVGTLPGQRGERHAARDAYLRELDGIVLPRFAARIKQHLVGYAASLKSCTCISRYIMLGEPKHLDKKHLQSLADLGVEDALMPRPARARRCRTISRISRA